MKGIVVLALIGVAAAAGLVYMNGQMMKDPLPQYLIAFGEPTGEKKIEMNICMPLNTRKAEVPPEGGIPRVLEWYQWIDRHWLLADESGAKVPITSMGSSTLVSDAKAGGAPDGWLRADLDVGKSYTLTYTPMHDEPKTFQYKFTADDNLPDRTRIELEPS